MNNTKSVNLSSLTEKRTLSGEIWDILWPIILITIVKKLGAGFEGILVSAKSAEELAITSICEPYTKMLTTISYGLGIAMNSIIGRASRDGVWIRSGRAIVKFSIILVLIFGYGMSVISVFLLRPSLALSGIKASLAWSYMMPYLLCSPILLLYSMLMAAMRGLGNAKAGLKMTLISVPVNLLLTYVLYTCFGLGMLSWGYILSQVAGTIYAIYICSENIHTEGTDPLPKGFVRQFLVLAVPLSLTKMVAPGGNAAINALILTFGREYVAATGLTARLEAYFYLCAMSMGSVAVTLVSRAEHGRDMKELAKALCLWSLVPTVVTTAAGYLLKDQMWQILTKDPAVQSAGILYWSIALFAYPFIALEMTTTGILQAYGLGVPMLIITAIRTWGVQLGSAWLAVKFGLGVEFAWWGYVAGNVTAFLISLVWAWIKIKGEKNEHQFNSRGSAQGN